MEADGGAFPVWQIDGPLTGLALVKQGTGEEIRFEGLALNEGDTLSIDTGPMAKMVGDAIAITRANGDTENGWRYLTSESVLWKLSKGSNNIQVELSGGAPMTRVTLTYRGRHSAPWSEDEQ